MSDLAAMLLVLTASPVVLLAVHMAMARIFRQRPAQVVVLGAAAVSFCAVFGLLWVIARPAGGAPLRNAAVYCSLVYGGIAYFYFHFFNTSETARRIRLLNEIFMAGSLSEREITALYNTTDVVQLRLRRLAETKQLAYANGYYRVDGKLMYYGALIVAFWQRVLGMDAAAPLHKEEHGGASGSREP